MLAEDLKDDTDGAVERVGGRRVLDRGLASSSAMGARPGATETEREGANSL